MSTELIVLEKLELVPFFTKGDSVDDLLAQIEAEAMAHVPDVSTKKGRDAIKANVTKITKSKTYLESHGKDLAAEYKLIPKQIDANRKKVKDFLNSLQELAREQLTQWEADQKKIEVEAARRAEFDGYHETAVLMMADDFRKRAEAVEQARLDQIAHDEAIALEATQKAEQDAADAIARAEVAKQEAEVAKQEAIVAAKVAEEKAKQDKIDAENAAKQAVIDAENKAAQAALDAENAAKQAAKEAEEAKQYAIWAEQKRHADEAAQVKAEQEARERNTQHKGRINSQAKADLMQYADLTEEQAIKVVKSLANRKISAVQINY